MTERWREKLGALGRAEPDQGRLRTLSAGGPRTTEPPPHGPSRVLAGVVAIAVAAGGFAFLVAAFRDGSGDRTASGLDPAAICDVPPYDPDVALLIGQPVREVALADLEAPGAPASELEGPATDALRAYLASPAAVHAPTAGWRGVDVEGEEVVFVAPDDDEGRWWVTGFTAQPDGDWRMIEEEIVDQEQTPAQRGHGLRLEWAGSLALDDGRWNDPLQLMNESGEPWADQGLAHWGFVHVFPRGSDEEVGGGVEIATSWGASYDLPPGQELPIPAALGGHLPVLTQGTYDVVACLPQLGLASSVGTLEVGDPGVVPGVHVMTFPGTTGMQALGGGTLEVAGGCLTLGGAGRTTQVLWPHGYAFVGRDGRELLIDPIGDEVGALGDHLSVGGGWVHLSPAEDLVVGGIPESCRVGGESYFVTSGLADAA